MSKQELNSNFFCFPNEFLRQKDNKFVFCAMDEVMGPMLEKARSEGLQITTVIHKVIM